MTKRGRYDGVANIWRYNRRFYLSTLVLLVFIAAVSIWLPFALRALALAGVAVGAYWTFASLAVSHYIYDRSSLYDFSWMPASVRGSSLVNVHAGLDESSKRIREQFPRARLRIFDIFDRNEMPEPSIHRARELSHSTLMAEAVSWRALPAEDNDCDAVFVIFSAHELRRHEARVAFLREAARIAKPNGRLVLIEHLRDVPNFLAFGPGFFHFFSRAEWLATATDATWALHSEFPITPFVRVFIFQRAL